MFCLNTSSTDVHGVHDITINSIRPSVITPARPPILLPYYAITIYFNDVIELFTIAWHWAGFTVCVLLIIVKSRFKHLI